MWLTWAQLCLYLQHKNGLGERAKCLHLRRCAHDALHLRACLRARVRARI